MVRTICILLCLLFSSLAHAGPWNWAPLGPHQNAVVHVQLGDGSAGTGTLIYTDKKYTNGFVLTAAHVVGGNTIATAKWREPYAPYSSSGRIVYNNSQSDVAIFTVDPPDKATVIPISSERPRAGAQVECIGLGSPRASLRPYYGHVMSDGQINAHVTHGDSGGPIVYEGGVVGTITGGVNVSYRVENGWQVYHPMVVSTYADVLTAARRCSVPDT